jgi:hypothetical protein
MWDKRKENPCMHKTFDSIFLGPYRIERKTGINSFYLYNLDGERFPFPVNGELLKLYFPTDT